MGLLLIFVSMLLAWNAIPQPEWCKQFWEWVASFWNKKEVAVVVKEEGEK